MRAEHPFSGQKAIQFWQVQEQRSLAKDFGGGDRLRERLRTVQDAGTLCASRKRR